MPRLVDKVISSKLESMGAVLIEGPKWCGKTRSAREASNSALYIRGSTSAGRIKGLIDLESTVFLEGDPPMLIDEWQNVPEIWDVVRFEVDERGEPGQFILTGSAVPPADATMHSGVGRFAVVRMRTMSLFESGESNGSVSLSGLFGGEGVNARSNLTLEALVHAGVRGGWPGVIGGDSSSARPAEDYLRILVSEDMSRFLYRSIVNGSGEPSEGPQAYNQRVHDIAFRTVQSISRNLATAASAKSICRDVNARENLVSEPTLAKYLGALDRLFVTENLEAWNPHVRSRTRLRKARKWHFTDPSLAAAALGAGEADLLRDYNALGFFFESMCLRDLRAYLDPVGGRVSYLANNNGYEVDFILELPDGRWAGVEAKLGDSEFDRAAENLLKLGEFVDTGRLGEPAFLAILTAMPYGYTRPDGVHVVPLGCLRD